MLTAFILSASLAQPHLQESESALELLHAHYARVAEEIAAREVEGLSDAARARRAEMVAELLRYNAAAEFTRGDVPGVRAPIFVDPQGRHCAVANLLRVSGEGELVARVAAANNGAWVCDLAGDAQFAAWLDSVGLAQERGRRERWRCPSSSGCSPTRRARCASRRSSAAPRRAPRKACTRCSA